VTQACALLQKKAPSRQRFIGLFGIGLALAGVAAATYTVLPDSGALTTSHGPTAVAPQPALAATPAANPNPPALAVASAATRPAETVRSAQGLLQTEAPKPDTQPAPDLPAIPVALVVPAPAASAAAPVASAPAALSAPVTKGRFYINVGLFANESNAHNAHAKLRTAGLAAFMQEVQSAKGKVTRVRVGPFNTRSEANAAVLKIQALQLDAVVFQQ
jgi:cell division septation protein DedD